MRMSLLLTSVFLFVLSGGAVPTGAGEITTQSNTSASAGSRRAARQLNRQTRRTHRATQRAAVRAAHGLQTRLADGASFQADAAASGTARMSLMAQPGFDVPQDDGDEPTADEGSEPKPCLEAHFLTFGDANSEAGNTYSEIDLVAGGYPVYEDGSQPVCPEEHPNQEDYHYLYTMTTVDGEVIAFRGNNGAATNGNGRAQPGPRSFSPFRTDRPEAALNANVHARVQSNVNPATVLTARLAEIDQIRDRALAAGDTALLDRADRLEATVRQQYSVQIGEAPAEPAEPTEPSATTP